MQEFKDNLDFSNIQTNEVLLTAYNYQQQNAQFYSQWFTKHDNYGKTAYGTLVYTSPAAPTYADAMSSAGARPTVFQPRNFTTPFGQAENQVDGSVNAYSPALYAFLMQTGLKE